MKLLLFTDGSVNTKLRVGYGAYLALLEGQQVPTSQVQLRRFEDTSSSKLEIQTLSWALSEISAHEVISYTDCQNIVGLSSRRKRLEAKDYYTRNGTRLGNYELYEYFFKQTDSLDITFSQIKGYSSTHSKNHIEMLFSLVDRASRKALRAFTADHNATSEKDTQK